MTRYVTYYSISPLIQQLTKRFSTCNFRTELLGTSVNGNNIELLSLGRGSTKIMIWSQMHGNESTVTRGLFKYLISDISDSILERISLYIIPILNPDGAESWTRVNANGVDLNRDCVIQSQPETKALLKAIDAIQPDFCFNLHDQRTFYGTKDGSQPIPLSFLAPAGDINKTIGNARRRAMSVINDVVHSTNLPWGTIGRYYDDFNPACIGDYCMSKNIPTILVEAGQLGIDYSRSNMVSVIANCLSIALNSLINNNEPNDNVVAIYESIPLVDKTLTDILLVNYPSASGIRKNLSIMYHELIHDDELYYLPVLTDIDAIGIIKGLRTVDCSQIELEDADLIVNPDFSVKSDLLEIKVFN